MHVPAREQTDPWISRLLYMYIDPIVVLANKVSHLNTQQLPPLKDVDYADYLQKQAFPVGGNKYYVFGPTLKYLSISTHLSLANDDICSGAFCITFVSLDHLKFDLLS